MPILNPNHLVSQLLGPEAYGNLLALIVQRTADKQIIVTKEEISTLQDLDLFLVIHSHKDSIELRLVPKKEAYALVKEQGGEPH